MGTAGAGIFALMRDAQNELETVFKCQVTLRLSVKVKKDLDRLDDEDLV